MSRFYNHPCEGELLAKAKVAAQKALELDGSSVEAHTSLALISYWADWDWAAAEKEFKHAIDLNPNYAHAHSLYSDYLVAVNRLDDAIAEAELAIRLDPLSGGYAAAGHKYVLAGQTDRAIELYRKASIQDAPVSTSANIARAYTEKGMYEEAIREYKASLEGADPYSAAIRRAHLARAYALSGQTREALVIVRGLEEYAKANCFPVLMAYVHTALGDKDKAFAWLESGFQQRDPDITWIRVDPAFSPLLDDPRFEALVKRMNFPEN
jgi:serine/threonine-protein kinase